LCCAQSSLIEATGIEIATRDRSRAYAEAIADGAPDAVRIADRWHILKNLYESLPITKGLTSRAIAARKTVNIDDVAADSDYLVALDGTRSEIIVTVLSEDEQQVIGALDVESEHTNAFDHLTQRFLEECALLIRSFWSDVTTA
jgi:uncharacterized protein YqfB (UPF0267 family)